MISSIRAMAVRLLSSAFGGFVQQQQQQSYPIPQQLTQTSKKILIVDDDDAVRNMVERVLRREHFDVESARDGFEAIEKLTRNDYATVLLDLMMPRVDGLGVLRFLETEVKSP